jgi:hypothetical protein
LERKAEFGEQIAQQAATIDVLKVMSASPGDPQPVFDLIVERARTCCGAELAALTLLDGDLLRLRAVSVGIESGFPRGGKRWSLGGRFGFWDAP